MRNISTSPIAIYLAAGGQLSVFAVNKTTGKLAPLQQLPLSGAGPFTFAPNRELMYATASTDVPKKKTPTIATLAIAADGKLKLAHQAAVNLRPGYFSASMNPIHVKGH